MSSAALHIDAKNRAVRTFLQNMGVDAAVAVVTLLLPLVVRAGSFSDLDWRYIAFSVAKTVVLVVFSYVMRRFMDPSSFPTALPPEYAGPPNENVDEDY